MTTSCPVNIRMLPARRGAALLGRVEARGHLNAVGAARIPLDEPVHLRQARLPGRANAWPVHRFQAHHQRDRIEPRVQPRQQRGLGSGRAEPLGQRDHALQVVLRVLGRVLRARAQRQLEAEPVRTDVRRQRAVAIDANVSAAHAFLGRAAVVHGEGVDVHRQPATGQHAVVRRAPREPRLDHRQHLRRQGVGLRVHALAQRRAGGQQRDAQCALVELVLAVVLDGVEVALALHQPPNVAAHDVAVAHAGAHRQQSVQPGLHRRQGLQVVPHQGQAGHRGEVVIELLDLDGVHAQIIRTARCIANSASPSGCWSTEVRSRIQAWGKKPPFTQCGEAKNGPLRPNCSRRSPSPTGS